MNETKFQIKNKTIGPVTEQKMSSQLMSLGNRRERS